MVRTISYTVDKNQENSEQQKGNAENGMAVSENGVVVVDNGNVISQNSVENGVIKFTENDVNYDDEDEDSINEELIVVQL